MGFSEAKALLRADDMGQAREYAGRIMALTGGRALYWCVKALDKELTHLRPRKSRYRTTSLLERFNRDIRARERMGTVWTVPTLCAAADAGRSGLNHLNGNTTWHSRGLYGSRFYAV